MIDSPLDSLYYMIKSVFTPALRDAKTGSSSTQQIQNSLSELEQVLRAAGKKGGGSSIGNVFHPKDEIDYWTQIANGGSTKDQDVDRAKYFLQILGPVKADFEKLDKYVSPNDNTLLYLTALCSRLNLIRLLHVVDRTYGNIYFDALYNMYRF